MSTPKLCLVIDVESTCWEKNPPSGAPIMERKNEIIEIGVTPISMPDRKILESESIIVWPTTTEVSAFCTELTTLTQEYVDQNGVPFASAISYLVNKYRTDRNMWASWGMYDEQAFRRQCEREFVKYPFTNNYLNVKSLYCWKYGAPAGLGRACRRLNIPFQGTAHRGVDDSRMIAKILLDMGI